jgi:hypothetical protein
MKDEPNILTHTNNQGPYPHDGRSYGIESNVRRSHKELNNAAQASTTGKTPSIGSSALE